MSVQENIIKLHREYGLMDLHLAQSHLRSIEASGEDTPVLKSVIDTYESLLLEVIDGDYDANILQPKLDTAHTKMVRASNITNMLKFAFNATSMRIVDGKPTPTTLTGDPLSSQYTDIITEGQKVCRKATSRIKNILSERTPE